MDSQWITNSERMYNIEDNFIKNQHSSIQLYFIYINKDLYIDKIQKSSFDLSSNIISKNKILQIAFDNRLVSNNSIYNFDYISLFNIPIEHENINEFNNTYHFNDTFLTNLSINNDIIIPSSLFIFQPYTSLFLFYKQSFLDTKVKSILKSSSSSSSRKKHIKTKKQVRINEKNFRKTKKTI